MRSQHLLSCGTEVSGRGRFGGVGGGELKDVPTNLCLSRVRMFYSSLWSIHDEIIYILIFLIYVIKI
jgi:hypothetical protein